MLFSLLIRHNPEEEEERIRGHQVKNVNRAKVEHDRVGRAAATARRGNPCRLRCGVYETPRGTYQDRIQEMARPYSKLWSTIRASGCSNLS